MNGGRPTPWRVDVLAYPGCFSAELFGLVEILGIANSLSTVLRPGTSKRFRTRVVAVRHRPIPLAGGVTVHPDSVGHRDATDQIIVPGFELADPADVDDLLTRLAPEIGFLRTFADGGITLGSVCLGAFVLAEAGLLDGCAATTSWLFAPELGRRYPKVDVRAAAMVVEDGRIATAAAFTAYTDLALRLVSQRAGDQVARATARITLTGQHRASQAPFVDERLLPVAHARFSDDVRNWLRHRIAEPYDLAHLSSTFNVSTRTMLRRFGAETGESPLAYLRRSRIAAAKRLLETSDLAVQTILGQVGYGDAATFRRLFADQTGMTPSEYRRQFRGRPR